MLLMGSCKAELSSYSSEHVPHYAKVSTCVRSLPVILCFLTRLTPPPHRRGSIIVSVWCQLSRFNVSYSNEDNRSSLFNSLNVSSEIRYVLDMIILKANGAKQRVVLTRDTL